MADKIITHPATPEYRDGWDRVFGGPICQQCKHPLGSEFERNCPCNGMTGMRRVSDGKTLAECNAECNESLLENSGNNDG